MSELKGLVANDPMKSAADVANYNVEFQDLQTLLFILSGYEFNGHRLFDLNGTQSFASGGITIDGIRHRHAQLKPSKLLNFLT